MHNQMVNGPSTQSATEVILYYRLTASHLPAVQQTIGSGMDVACLTADAAVMESAAEAVRFLGLSALPNFWEVIEAEAIIGLVETVFNALTSRSTILSWLHKLYGSPDIDHYFRRQLLYEMGNLLSAASLAGRPPIGNYDSIVLAPDWPGSSLWPLFLDLWQQADTRRQLAVHLPQPICVALDRLSVAGEPRRGITGMVKRYARPLYHVARTWYLALRQLCPRTRWLPPARLLLRTYATDWGVNLGGQDRLRNVDFVVDGNEVPVEDVAIWVEPGTSEERRQALRQRGYRLLSADDVTFNPATFVRRVLPLLLSYTALLPRLVRENRWWYGHVAALIHNYLIWQEVCRQMKPAAFLAYNDLSSAGVARNIVLRQHGCCSVFYQHSCNTAIGGDGDWAVHLVYPYLVFDAIATWGRAHSDLFRRHPGAVGDYWEVGCLWSEHARLVGEDGILNQQYRQRLASHLSTPLDQYRRRVAVFDTSVSSMLSAHDLASLYAGVLRLAQRLPDVLFVCKPKNPIEDLFAAAGEFGDQVRRSIGESSNVVLLPNYFETAAVVGLTDLTISACFTSTTVEAIGCGQRAIYYDPTNRVPHAFWRRIPGLVCVADEELYERVRYLLWECDDATYMDYLRTHCMGIEGYFDGRAITRLRRRLLEVMNGR